MQLSRFPLQVFLLGNLLGLSGCGSIISFFKKQGNSVSTSSSVKINETAKEMSLHDGNNDIGRLDEMELDHYDKLASEKHIKRLQQHCNIQEWVNGSIDFMSYLSFKIPSKLPAKIGLSNATHLKLSVSYKSGKHSEVLDTLTCDYQRTIMEPAKRHGNNDGHGGHDEKNSWNIMGCTNGSLKKIALVNKINFSIGTALPSKEYSETVKKAKVTLGCLDIPVDPGESGQQTIAGIDSNNNGIRDDVERWIVLNFPDSQKRRAALMQDAKDTQSAILAYGDKDASIAAVQRLLRTSECTEYVFNDHKYDHYEDLKPVYYNTKERLKAWIKVNENFDGQTFTQSRTSDDKKATCKFDLNSMEN